MGTGSAKPAPAKKLPIHLHHRTPANWRRMESLRWWLRLRGGLDRVLLNTRVLADDLGSPGVAHLCDWSLTDIGFHGNLRRQPRTLFVQPRHEILDEFFARYYPRIAPRTRFVLVTGAADHTLPHQTDLRYKPFAGTIHADRFAALRADPRLRAWYSDNLDDEAFGAIPIPCGSAGRYGCGPEDGLRRHRGPVSLEGRALRALCTHRERPGPQWDKRRGVSALAAGPWRDFVDLDNDIPCDRFFPTLCRYAFTLCVTGGGLDPSPKAWMAILAGSIPVIESNPMARAYDGLPVAVIDRWEEGALDPARMAAWLADLRPWHEDPIRRAAVVRRLALGPWWRMIRSAAAAPVERRPGRWSPRW